MTNYVTELVASFRAHENETIAQEQSNYMRNQFEFFGLKSQERRLLQREFLKSAALPPKSELKSIITEIWEHPQCELHYVGQ